MRPGLFFAISFLSSCTSFNDISQILFTQISALGKSLISYLHIYIMEPTARERSLGVSRTGATQADRLPKFKQIVIPLIKKLRTPRDLYFWGNCIHVALIARNLLGLTSDTLPRPPPYDPNYENWAKWSRLVSVWLVKNVDPDFTTYFKDHQVELEFADTTYKAIQTLDIGEEEEGSRVKTPEVDRMTKALVKLWNTRRSGFQSIDRYVDAWRDEVIACQSLATPFDYHTATKIMLHEIQDELPILAAYIDLQVQAQHDDQKELSYNQFNGIVRGIIGAVQKEHWKPL
jgi:hypothetical protein